MSSNGFGVDLRTPEGARHVEPARPLELRRALLQLLDVLPANRLEHVELAGAQRGDEGRLVLDGAIDELVDERQLVFAAVDLLLVPVVGVLDVGVGVALHEVGQHERPGAVDVLPVGGPGVDHLLGIDAREVAVAEAVVPLGEVVLEGEDDGVLVGRLDLVDVVEVALDLARAAVEPVVGEDHVVGDELARLHDARLLREHDALAQLDLDAQRVLLPLPAFGQLAADGVGRQPGVGIEGMRAAALDALRQVAGEQLLVELAGVVVVLPVPVVRVPRQRRQRHVDRADLERAAVLRLVGVRQRLPAPSTSDRPKMPAVSPAVMLPFLIASSSLVFFYLEPQRDPRMRGSNRSRSASPNMLVA